MSVLSRPRCTGLLPAHVRGVTRGSAVRCDRKRKERATRTHPPVRQLGEARKHAKRRLPHCMDVRPDLSTHTCPDMPERAGLETGSLIQNETLEPRITSSLINKGTTSAGRNTD